MDAETKKNRAMLYKKIAQVTAQMKRVPKSGENTFHKYRYVTESDLTDAIRELLDSNGLAFLPPTVLEHERIPMEGRNGPLTRVKMQFALACTDTGEEVTSVLWADGQDGADKGFYKAYTGGVKYFLMKTFLVSTGDDPEQDTHDERQSAQQPQRTVQGATPRTKPVDKVYAATVQPAQPNAVAALPRAREFFATWSKALGEAGYNADRNSVVEYLGWEGTDAQWWPVDDDGWDQLDELMRQQRQFYAESAAEPKAA